MPHIQLPEGLPGIRGPMRFRPETAKPMNEFHGAITGKVRQGGKNVTTADVQRAREPGANLDFYRQRATLGVTAAAPAK